MPFIKVAILSPYLCSSRCLHRVTHNRKKHNKGDVWRVPGIDSSKDTTELVPDLNLVGFMRRNSWVTSRMWVLMCASSLRPGVATPLMVATGAVEFGIVGGDQIMTIRAHGAPVVAVYAAFNVYPRAFMVHERAPPVTQGAVDECCSSS